MRAGAAFSHLCNVLQGAKALRLTMGRMHSMPGCKVPPSHSESNILPRSSKTEIRNPCSRCITTVCCGAYGLLSGRPPAVGSSPGKIWFLGCARLKLSAA